MASMGVDDVGQQGDTGTDTRTRVRVGPDPLAPDDVVAVARYDAGVELTTEALAEIGKTREVIEHLAAATFRTTACRRASVRSRPGTSPSSMRAQLQRSLIRSHAAGSGAEVEREVVRAMMLLRLSTLATGRTGVRTTTAANYAGMLDAGITPVVREYGSLGCSGDLAPLAHCALALMGEGEVRTADGTLMPAAQALGEAGIEPVELAEKEGLALINGTDGMLGMLILAAHDLRRLLRVADIAAAMSVEALLGTDRVFADDLQALRPHPGQAASAANLRALLAGSGIVASHRGPDCTRVQDAYSLRCSPQVHGAARDTLAHAETVAGRELAAAIDNPVVTLDGRVESNGNFHGAPVGYVLDFLAIATADVASMSERRTDRFLDVARNGGLPAFLADDPGVDSGHMIAQYTQAAIVSELKRLAVPPPSTRSRPAPCRRTTSPWAGARAASSAAPWTGSPRCSPSNCSRPRGRSTCARRSNQPPARPRCALCYEPTSTAPGRTGISRPRSTPSSSWSAPAPSSRRPKPPSDRCNEASEEAMTAGPRTVTAPRGTTLHAKGWPQEAALRMLQNNLDPEVAEHPEDLVVYGGTGRAARDWPSFEALVRTLTTLGNDETMLVQSGRPVGVMRTHEWAPRVLIANSNLVGDWATWEEFRRLEALGLTMYGQMTAGSWIYIGTQGILQGTYETFAAVAAKRFGGSLAGTITLTAGLGGMGGAQPLAVTMNDGVAIVVECDPSRITPPARAPIPRRGRALAGRGASARVRSA